MLKIFRLICCASFLLIAVRDLRAASMPGASVPLPASVVPATPPLPAELQAELERLARASWLPSVSARASLGWRDNVLLSPFAPLARAFARAEVEAILMRPMRNRWQFVSFLNGDVLRYFAPPPETHGEQQWSLFT
jgi:hypothetical protein